MAESLVSEWREFLIEVILDDPEFKLFKNMKTTGDNESFFLSNHASSFHRVFIAGNSFDRFVEIIRYMLPDKIETFFEVFFSFFTFSTFIAIFIENTSNKFVEYAVLPTIERILEIDSSLELIEDKIDKEKETVMENYEHVKQILSQYIKDCNEHRDLFPFETRVILREVSLLGKHPIDSFLYLFSTCIVHKVFQLPEDYIPSIQLSREDIQKLDLIYGILHDSEKHSPKMNFRKEMQKSLDELAKEWMNVDNSVYKLEYNHPNIISDYDAYKLYEWFTKEYSSPSTDPIKKKLKYFFSDELEKELKSRSENDIFEKTFNLQRKVTAKSARK